MTMSVTMLTTVMGESGSLLNSGSTYTVTRAFGAGLVHNKQATDTNGALIPQQTENKVYANTDPATGAVSLVAGGSTMKVGSSQPGLKIVLWGDSAMQYGLQWTALIAGQLTQVGGVATLALSGAHLSNVGQRFWIINSSDKYWYGEHFVSSVVDANTLTFSVDARASADAVTSAFAGTQVHFQAGSYYGQANPFLAGMFAAGIIPDDVVFLGANSQTATDMLTHIDADLAAYPSHDLWVCSTVGANEVRVSTPGNLPVAIAKAKENLIRLKNAGKRVLYLGWQPNDSRDAAKDRSVLMTDGSTQTTGSVAMAEARFNEEMKVWCAAVGIDMISQYDYLLDPTSTSGYAKTSMLIADGVHLGKRGAFAIEQAVKTWLLANYSGAANTLVCSLRDRYKSGDSSGAGTIVNPASRQIFRNPLLITTVAADANGNTRPESVTLASSFGMPAIGTPAAAGTYNVTARSDGFGNDFYCTWSSTVASVEQAGSITFNLAPADVAVGKDLWAAVHVQIEAQSHHGSPLLNSLSMGVEAYLSVTCSNYSQVFMASQKIGGASGSSDRVEFLDTELINRVLSVPKIAIPADAVITQAVFIVRGFSKATATATQSNMTLRVGRPSVWSNRN